MNLNGYLVMADTVTKFFNTIRVTGWFHHPEDALASIGVVGTPVTGCITEIGLHHAGVAALGSDKGFAVQLLRPQEELPDDAALVFTTRSGWSATVKLQELAADRIALYPGSALVQRFRSGIAAIPGARVLDIGGRARSQLDRSQEFPGAEVTVLDILPGDNVDIVADAHMLASALPHDHFDAVYSVSVFEHLMMPWAVIPQMNQVMRLGATALISTHQTIGMHDMPWDFWRFSDTAWDALFNPRTGFEILDRILESEQYVIPFVYRPIKAWAERAAGYEGSAVLVRKTGPCTLAWPVAPGDFVATMYPTGTEDPYALKSSP
ncbi:class I SAM-dependent methyltransferase [Sphingomonas sp.]|uniref:class I SAM-dependent methyltransferase n=1 Tax=Sphingomonas sp. TaxID=28214 RepID=UPI0035B47A91